MSFLIKPTYVSSSKLATVPIVNGRQITCIDNGMQYIDYNNTRILLTDIVNLEEDMERTTMSSPINGKFYFVKSTKILWHYNNQWVKIADGYIHSTSNVEPGTYIRVTTDTYGHVINANNDPITIAEGGTGGTTTKQALDNLGITSYQNTTDTRLDSLEASVAQLLAQVNNICLTYSSDTNTYFIETTE